MSIVEKEKKLETKKKKLRLDTHTLNVVLFIPLVNNKNWRYYTPSKHKAGLVYKVLFNSK